MSPVARDMCKQFRGLEDKMVDDQRVQPRIHAEFRQQIKVYAKGLEDARVSKRNIRLAELSRTGRRQKQMMEREAIADRDDRLIKFRRWLESYEHAAGQRYVEGTVETYYRIIRRLFFIEEDIEVIEENNEVVEENNEVIVQRAQTRLHELEALPQRGPEVQNELQSLRRFVEYRSTCA